jgi:UDP-N-acetylmuramoylalanine--D-glutamate ligase
MSKYGGKMVLVVGFGLSGVASARYLAQQGARVVISDMKQRTELTDSLKACGDLKLEYDFGKHTPKYFHEADLIVVSPGVPLNLRPLQEAREKHVPITTEVELAGTMIKEDMIAVTGTNGKTTTVTLLGEIFKQAQKKCFLGGNIGRPLLDYVSNGCGSEVVVTELSSFQLELTERLAPKVAIFTNIGQDHLDRYPDMDSYIRAKKRLLLACDQNSAVILNYDDPVVSRFATETVGRVLWFTRQNPIKIGGGFAEKFEGAYYLADTMEVVTKIAGVENRFCVKKLRLFGDHNKENVMAAVCAALEVRVEPVAIQAAIDAFKGVPHRLEFVRKKNGVYFINDSKATNVMSLYRSLLSFRKNPIILIAGGKDKDMDFSPLRDIVEKRCKMLILVGEAKEKLNRTLGDSADTFLMGTFEEAILMAYQKSRTGDIILLSPGCASQDMFRNYEERGDYFRKMVQQL